MNVWNFARSPASVLLMIEYARGRQIAPPALLKGSQLTLKQLADPDFTVLAAQELTVASNLLRLTGHEGGVGLKVGLSYHLSAYGLLGYGLLSSATGKAAIALAGRYPALTYTFVRMEHRRAGRHDVITFTPSPELSADLQRFFVERAMGATCRVLRDVIGSEFELAAFDLAYGDEPGGKRQVLGARIRPGQPANVLTFEHAHLERPLPQANAVTAAMCERMCAELLARRRTRLDMVSFLNEYLATHTFDSPPKLKDIAALLNTSERTLKRRLQEEGACFRDISNAVRKARAKALIDEGRLSIKEIAQALGFCDVSSFSQAYKRWTGAAPSVARRQANRP
ncbi:AraC family transcriptional regulator [Burkholderia ubonensis]|uniref:AraC family transcriptional regulator n=1 Tax=Burkholderia ubonensis TaxID=101571 RepID=A0A103R2T2_9BURK|nr:AraC family transcriptional regulator [Burkholderia ubonensis]AOJ66866.1 AraC family transcriptional regulator [Burkholderia ubonensis]KVG60177.1 AraC family transcriptional regulator [Burkholderia ubonensis]